MPRGPASDYHRRVTAPPLSPALAAYVEGAAAILVGSCDADGVPEGVRGVGVQLGADRTTATVLIPAAVAATTLANLRANPRLAVTAADLPTFGTVQLKGMVTEVRDATAAERPLALAYRARFAQEFAWTGADVLRARRVVAWPCVALALRIDAIHATAPDPRAEAP